MGKRIILSESEKLNIQNLYKGLLSEQRNTPTSKVTPNKEGGKDGGIEQNPEKGGEQGDKKPNPRKYLPISDKFCDIALGKAQVKRGAKGELVELFQEALNACGIEPLKPLEVDGDFGKLTRDAVRAFQEKNGLKVDGGIGTETAGKLCELGCIPKEVCDKCNSKKDGNQEQVPTPIKDGAINVDCEKVQACISKFMGGLKEDFCIDEDKIKGLLQCVGVGQCFEGGKVPPPNMIEKPTVPNFPDDRKYIQPYPGPTL